MLTGIKRIQELLKDPLFADGLDELKHQCYINLGMAYQELKNNLTALKFYYKAVQLRESDFATWMKISKICIQKKYFEQADFCLQTALQHVPSLIYENILYEQMTHVSYLKRAYEECLKKIDFLEKKDPFNANIILLKACCYRQLGYLFFQSPC